MTVLWLHALAAAAWAYVLVTHAPSGWRTMRGRGLPGDRRRTSFWFVAAVFVGYFVRWMAYPSDVAAMSPDGRAMWAGLHVLSFLACAGVVWANRIEDGR